MFFFPLLVVVNLMPPPFLPILVALYRAIRLRFGYGFESCDATGARETSKTKTWRDVKKKTKPGETKARCFPHFALLVVRNRS